MWEFYPLDLGTACLKKNILIKDGSGDEEKLLVPSTAWLLINDDLKRHILVDTGPSKDSEWGKQYHNQYVRKKEQSLAYQLCLYNSSIEKIDTIILTHLHWDHAYGVFEVPNAQIIVQKKELLYAIDPFPCDRVIYELNLKFQIPYFLKFFNRIMMIDGDYQILEGLSVIQLPGHSPGSQGVIVETAVGKIVIAGDLINLFQNWEENLPCGIITSKKDWYNSLNKLKKINAVVLPSHDYAVFEYVKNLKRI